jgi:hypothetical protein
VSRSDTNTKGEASASRFNYNSLTATATGGNSVSGPGGSAFAINVAGVCLWAHRDILQCRASLVAFGAERTSLDG